MQPVHRRGEDRGPAPARQHRAGLRARRGRRPVLHGHGVRARARPARGSSRARSNKGAFPIPLALFITARGAQGARVRPRARPTTTGTPLHIVHCDISPAERARSRYAGEVKITDFGISRAAFQARSLHDVIRGKYAYMSPEQVDGQAARRPVRPVLARHRAVRAPHRPPPVQGEDPRRDARAGAPGRGPARPRSYRPETLRGPRGVPAARRSPRTAEDRYQTAGELLEDARVARWSARATGRRTTTSPPTSSDVIESDRAKGERAEGALSALEPSAVVVVACEASPPPRIAVDAADVARRAHPGVVAASSARRAARSGSSRRRLDARRAGSRTASSRTR